MGLKHHMARKISIDKMHIDIDGTVLRLPISIVEVETLLGKPSRLKKGANLILTYDLDSLHFHSDDGKNIQQLTVTFDPGWYEFSPNLPFTGSVEILGIELNSVEDFVLAGSEGELDKDEMDGDGFVGLRIGRVAANLQFSTEDRKLIDACFYYLE
jgi:hypothetical protein